MSRSRWVYDLWAEWDDGRDPALLRGREALTLRAPGPSDGAGVASGATSGPDAALTTATRRERIAALVHRIENGDLSAVATLRELLLDK